LKAGETLSQEFEPAGLESALADGAPRTEFFRAHVAEVDPASPALNIQNLDDVALSAGGRRGYKAHPGTTSTRELLGVSKQPLPLCPSSTRCYQPCGRYHRAVKADMQEADGSRG